MELGEVETYVKGSNGIRWDLSEANVTGCCFTSGGQGNDISAGSAWQEGMSQH